MFYGTSQYGILLQDINNVTTASLGIAGLNQPGTIAFHADTVSTRIFSNGVEVTGFPVTFSVGDVCRFASSPLGVWIGVNNQWIQNVGGTLTTVDTFPAANPTLPPLGTPPALATIAGFAESAGSNSFNYGQQPFVYTPPAGFKKLQTQNLPAADIVDGREHFRAITGPGSGTVGPNEIEVNPYTNPTGYLIIHLLTLPQMLSTQTKARGFTFLTNTNYTETAIKFDTPMTGTTFRVYVYVNQGGFQVNGTTISGTYSGWLDISTQAAGALSTLGFGASSSAADGFSRLQIGMARMLSRKVFFLKPSQPLPQVSGG